MSAEARISGPVRWLSTDFKKLKSLHDEGVGFYNTKVQPLYSAARLLELSQIDSQLTSFQGGLKELEYLKDLSDEMVWREY